MINKIKKFICNVFGHKPNSRFFICECIRCRQALYYNLGGYKTGEELDDEWERMKHNRYNE